MKTLLKTVAFLSLGFLLFCPGSLKAAEKSSLPPGAISIISDQSICRFMTTVRKPMVTLAAFKAAGKTASAPEVISVKVNYRSYPGINMINTPAPPKNWTASDFDDANWSQAKMASRHRSAVVALNTIPYGPATRMCNFRISVRTRFEVTNPSGVKELLLSFKYRGGALVYLNGQEVSRLNMPKGELKDETPADLYPEKAWVTPKGKAIPGERTIRLDKKLSPAEKAELKARVTARNRSVSSLKIPTKLLKKGVNVLSVEVRRSDYHPVALKPRKWGRWWPISLGGISMHAIGSGIKPNAPALKGFQVWNHNINDRVTVNDLPDPFSSLLPIKLYGARNGSFRSMLVAGSNTPVSGLKVVASDLKNKTGEKIPASDIMVSYPVANGKSRGNPLWFDGIEPKPSGASKLQPILLTIKVSAQSKPGLYSGSVTISATGGKTVKAQLQIDVAAWKIPDPKNFRTYIGIYQSPTSLALQYKVPMWSEEHWKLIEKSYALLATAGNKLINMHIVDKTQFGNQDGFVTWIRKKDGSYDYDFKVFDRLLDLAVKYWDKPEFVALQIWHSGGWAMRKADQPNTVTVRDEKTGKTEHLQVPNFASDEAKAFWKPLLAAVHKRLKKRGWEKTMCIGILSDGTAPKNVFTMFDSVWPGGAPARWTRGCHVHTNTPKPYRASKGGGQIVLHEHCYGMSMADPLKGLPALHKLRERPAAAYIRHNWDHNLSLLKFHNMAERGLYCGKRGIGRICLDFWSVASNNGSNKLARIYNRYPDSSCSQRAPTLYELAYASPKGPAFTVRFENFIEGIQECEALIYISQAAAESADKIGAKLVKSFKDLLIARMNYSKLRAPESYGRIHHRVNSAGFDVLNRRLYKLAGQVAEKLGDK
jgi:Glycoside hydrolase 123, catalytic domain/Glycoside hydrolase 123, N-terminal domain